MAFYYRKPRPYQKYSILLVFAVLIFAVIPWQFWGSKLFTERTQNYLSALLQWDTPNFSYKTMTVKNPYMVQFADVSLFRTNASKKADFVIPWVEMRHEFNIQTFSYVFRTKLIFTADKYVNIAYSRNLMDTLIHPISGGTFSGFPGKWEIDFYNLPFAFFIEPFVPHFLFKAKPENYLKKDFDISGRFTATIDRNYIDGVGQFYTKHQKTRSVTDIRVEGKKITLVGDLYLDKAADNFAGAITYLPFASLDNETKSFVKNLSVFANIREFPFVNVSFAHHPLIYEFAATYFPCDWGPTPTDHLTIHGLVGDLTCQPH